MCYRSLASSACLCTLILSQSLVLKIEIKHHYRFSCDNLRHGGSYDPSLLVSGMGGECCASTTPVSGTMA